MEGIEMLDIWVLCLTVYVRQYISAHNMKYFSEVSFAIATFDELCMTK